MHQKVIFPFVFVVVASFALTVFSAESKKSRATSSHLKMGDENITITTSNSIYHFSTTLAEIFGKTTEFRSPIVEPVGTGMGFKQFCQKASKHDPSFILSSRPIHKTEADLCQHNEIGEIGQIHLGYNGIVLATSKKNTALKGLTYDQLFRATSKNVPLADNNNVWVSNPHEFWSSVDASLPDLLITIYAPSTNTNTHEILTEHLLVNQCIHLCCPDQSYKERDEYCRHFRDDKHYLVGNDDGRLIVRKLLTHQYSVGIVDYSVYLANQDFINVLEIDNVQPSIENIRNGKYTLTRSIYVYYKKAHLEAIRGMEEFVNFLHDPAIVGPSGALSKVGLIAVEESNQKQTSK